MLYARNVVKYFFISSSVNAASKVIKLFIESRTTFARRTSLHTILYIILEHKVAAVTAECMEKCIEFVIYEDDVWRGKT